MKKLFFVLLVLLLSAPDSFGLLIKSEYILCRSTDPSCVTIDVIVSDTDLATTPGTIFNFLDLLPGPGQKGTKALYDASTLYCYYQAENPINTNLVQLTINTQDSSIYSAGYLSQLDNLNNIVGVDIDDGPFNHVVAGEYEAAVQQALDVPDIHDYETTGQTNATWGKTYPGLPPGYESTVLFLTGIGTPEEMLAAVLNSVPSWSGTLPAPFVPEPATMLLGLISLLLLRFKK